jgi:hypothetical protein
MIESRTNFPSLVLRDEFSREIVNFGNTDVACLQFQPLWSLKKYPTNLLEIKSINEVELIPVGTH